MHGGGRGADQTPLASYLSYAPALTAPMQSSQETGRRRINTPVTSGYRMSQHKLRAIDASVWNTHDAVSISDRAQHAPRCNGSPPTRQAVAMGVTNQTAGFHMALSLCPIRHSPLWRSCIPSGRTHLPSRRSRYAAQIMRAEDTRAARADRMRLAPIRRHAMLLACWRRCRTTSHSRKRGQTVVRLGPADSLIRVLVGDMVSPFQFTHLIVLVPVRRSFHVTW